MTGQGDDSSRGESTASGRLPLAATIRPDQAIQIDQLVSARLAKQQLKGSLLVIAGEPADIGTHWGVGPEVVVGRDPEGLAVRDGQASRRHLVVSATSDGHTVSDLGSTNGSLLNGVPLSEQKPLDDGDKITIGQTVIKFMLVDATEADYLRRMALLAGTDELTGLPAKHRFDSLLAEGFRSAQQMSLPLSLMMMDLDGLKAINDRHGHQMGAHTISQVGRMIGQILDQRGEACRFGGDEFSAMLPGTPCWGAKHVGEEIRAAVEATSFALAKTSTHATISIGVADTSAAGVDSVESLVAAADQALYRAKAEGRNRVSD